MLVPNIQPTSFFFNRDMLADSLFLIIRCCFLDKEDWVEEEGHQKSHMITNFL